MKIGTKSVLFGAHCFFIHPWFVALAWWKLYGFPWDPRLWVAFFVHDLGYCGKPNMDGPEGEEHPKWGASLMGRWFDKWRVEKTVSRNFLFAGEWTTRREITSIRCGKWFSFCLYHSRFLAKRDDVPFSRLCVADKLACALEPNWFYLLRVILSGEIREYMKDATDGKYAHENRKACSPRVWRRDLVAYLNAWVEEHRDGKQDDWTKVGNNENRETVTSSGVWK